MIIMLVQHKFLAMYDQHKFILFPQHACWENLIYFCFPDNHFLQCGIKC